jgi:hypothetical protein
MNRDVTPLPSSAHWATAATTAAAAATTIPAATLLCLLTTHTAVSNQIHMSL